MRRLDGVAARFASRPALALLALTIALTDPAGFSAGSIEAAPSPAGPPIIDEAAVDAAAGGALVVVHVVYRGARPLPPGATRADEEALRDEIAVAHRSFRASRPPRGFRILHEHAWTHGAVAEVDAEGLEALSRLPLVGRVYLDREVHPLLAEGVPLIGADDVHALGVTGDGVTIAIIDTGIDYSHSALGGCLGPSCKVVGGFDFVNDAPDPFDELGHGTAVAGVAASNGSGAPLGVAPGAGLAALKIFSANEGGTDEDLDEALNWVLSNRTAFNIKVVNMSIGDGGQYSSSGQFPCSGSNTANLIASLVNVGVAVAVASGNDGHDAGVSFPACVAQATAVGGVYDADLGSRTWSACTDSTTFADKFVCHSNAGAPLDLLAPDWRTTTSLLGGGTSNVGGTSVAAPYVAGAYALVFDVMPWSTVATVEANFKSTGVPVTNPGNGQSYPRVDVAAVMGLDADLDGEPDGTDNCPAVYNPAQADSDSDPSGDACDCDSANPAVHHGAPEVCDGVNNDCSDPDWPSLAAETDDDLDGQAECGGDCDDANSARFSGNPEACDGTDNNCDISVPVTENDADSDRFRVCAGDCDDANPARFPGNPEICDGLDNDCDSVVPGGESDGDLDGSMICEGDCDDSDGAIFPGAPETCDGRNNDCTHPGWPSLAVETDDDLDGRAECGGDCDDANPARFAGNPEVCDGLDNNCDLFVHVSENDADSDGARGCDGDCDDANPARFTGNPEVCDGIDNDCTAGVPASELDSDADGVRLCEGDCDDGNPGRFPGKPEICDGVDNDCDAVVPGGEFDGDLDGSMICEGDCDDSDGAIFPGAPETCDGRNNDCSHPAWPSLAVESDDDGDAISECAGDCDDTTTRVVPGHAESCDELDNDCDGRTDLGSPFFLEGNHLQTLPGAAAFDRLGTTALAYGDVDSDGTLDFAVGAAGWPSGISALGAVQIYSGDDRSPIRLLSDPNGTTPAELGRAMVSPGDVDGDGTRDLAASAPLQSATAPEQGRVILFSGATGTLLWSHQKTTAAFSARFGTSLEVIADVNANGKLEVVAGMLIGCGSGPDCGGTASILDGLTGATLRTLWDASGLPGDAFGAAMAGLGDQDADGDDELAVASPGKAASGASGAGQIRIYSTGNGALLRALSDPSPDADDGLGSALAAIDDLDGDGMKDLLAGSPGRNTGAGADAGQVLVFSGASGALLMRLEDPMGAAGDGLGSAVAAIPDLNGDGTSEVAAGAGNADTTAGTDAGKVVIFSGSDGAPVATLVHPVPGAADRFGASVAALGPFDGDGRHEIAVGAPDDDLGSANIGTLVLFSPSPIGDCDGDTIGNHADTCTDADADGYGNDAFDSPACPEDCDDANRGVFPGAPQICDGANNDCGDPSYPAVSPSECFAVTDLTAQESGAGLLLTWAVPAGGADMYRVYRTVTSDLHAGASGGYCFATSVSASILLSDPQPSGVITYYLVAGVRGNIEGSRGSMFPAAERPPGDICP